MHLILTTASACASILTSMIALIAGIRVLHARRIRRQALETYLQKIAADPAPGATRYRTLLHLSAVLGMSEEEILRASFGSTRIHRRLAANDQTGRAEAMLLEYHPDTTP